MMIENDVNELSAHPPLCQFYKDIYKRMRVNFGFTYPFWLSDMKEESIIKNTLNMVMNQSMYIIFINVAIRIKKNNNRPTNILTDCKRNNPDIIRVDQRKTYYADNYDRISAYNKMYTLLRNSRINLFKKNATSNV